MMVLLLYTEIGNFKKILASTFLVRFLKHLFNLFIVTRDLNANEKLKESTFNNSRGVGKPFCCGNT